ncbi:hypothetical protein GKZ28_12380 [Clostridium chromiireducens]|uniref:DUF5316 domain-containing protein n=1 Tax=Clostridium chromiireducens TaxID=225345 RepID=A0A964RMR5_9CLOT|nr:DUF5316 domain-containing protein [Clostridium chromiireducens]MVX64487.1 hypothetical protein [Clostridium chromiireducens]
MKLSFLIGSIIGITALLIGFLLGDYNITLKITGFVIAAVIAISGILNGSFVNGDRYRANFSSETKEDRDKKSEIINFLLVLSTPNIAIFIVLFIFGWKN